MEMDRWVPMQLWCTRMRHALVTACYPRMLKNEGILLVWSSRKRGGGNRFSLRDYARGYNNQGVPVANDEG